MKASVAAAILAFCANNALTAPISGEALSKRNDCAGKAFPAIWPPTEAELACDQGDRERLYGELPVDNIAKRDPALPALGLGAKLGAKVGARIGKELFFGDKRDLSERDPALPALGLGAKAGAKIGARIGKELFFGDEKRDLSKRDPALPALGLGAKAGAKIGARIGKELDFGDKRDLSKRDPALPAIPIAAKVGARIGAKIGKELFFGDKRDLSERELRVTPGDLYYETNPGEDFLGQPQVIPSLKGGDLSKREALTIGYDPSRGERDPLIDLGFKEDGLNLNVEVEKREAFINDLLKNIDPTDDDPLDPFDDEGIIGKRQLEFLPSGVKDPLRNFANNIDPNDDNPLNPFDDPCMIGKREAFINDLIKKIDPTNDDPLDPFDDPGMIGKRQLEFLPDVVKDPLRDFANNIDPNDDNPLNPFDDPGMIGKREPIFNKIGDLIEGIDPNDDSSLNPIDGLIG